MSLYTFECNRTSEPTWATSKCSKFEAHFPWYIPTREIKLPTLLTYESLLSRKIKICEEKSSMRNYSCVLQRCLLSEILNTSSLQSLEICNLIISLRESPIFAPVHTYFYSFLLLCFPIYLLQFIGFIAVISFTVVSSGVIFYWSISVFSILHSTWQTVQIIKGVMS